MHNGNTNQACPVPACTSYLILPCPCTCSLFHPATFSDVLSLPTLCYPFMSCSLQEFFKCPTPCTCYAFSSPLLPFLCTSYPILHCHSMHFLTHPPLSSHVPPPSSYITFPCTSYLILHCAPMHFLPHPTSPAANCAFHSKHHAT